MYLSLDRHLELLDVCFNFSHPDPYNIGLDESL